MPADKRFFDTVRPLFGGRLTQGQVDGLNKIVEYGEKWEYPVTWLAYALATAQHETANWMQPIYEGARRYGTDYTEERSVRAVTAIFNKGIISRNYSLPDGPYGNHYVGRGLVQITWHENYKRHGETLGVDLEQYPDLALEWDVALDLLFYIPKEGGYTGKKFSDFDREDGTFDYYNARSMINGDKRKNGKSISDKARVYEKALK